MRTESQSIHECWTSCENSSSALLQVECLLLPPDIYNDEVHTETVIAIEAAYKHLSQEPTAARTSLLKHKESFKIPLR